MTLSGFIRLMKDLGLLFVNPNAISETKNIHLIKKNKEDYFEEKKKHNLFSMNTINLIFSKYSKETENRKENKLKFRNEANKKLNYSSFLKVIKCISNKLFDNDYNKIDIDTCKNFDLELLNLIEEDKGESHFKMFVSNYLLNNYNQINTFIENESKSLDFLQNIVKDSKFSLFLDNLKIVFFKIFKIYTDRRENINIGELFK
jgi:hypothetical protein